MADFPGLGRENMSLKYLLMPNRKEVWKKIKVMKYVRRTKGPIWKSSHWPKLKRFQQEHKKSYAVWFFSLFLYSSHGVIWPRSWSQTQTSPVARPRIYCVKSARYRIKGEEETVNNRGPLASFIGSSYSPTPASSHTGSGLPDFPIFQERLTFTHEISQYCEQCTKWVQFWTHCLRQLWRLQQLEIWKYAWSSGE